VNTLEAVTAPEMAAPAAASRVQDRWCVPLAGRHGRTARRCCESHHALLAPCQFRYEHPAADLSELPGAVTVPPGLLPPAARPKFYQMANKDAPPAPRPVEELLPKEQRERWYLMPSLWDADRPGGGRLDDDEEDEEDEEEGSDAAVRGRKPRRRGTVSPGQVSPEDPTRWYTLRPHQVPDSTPHVLATLPEEREALAALCCGGDVREAVPVLPGDPTPWPEKGSKWYTLDNTPRYRQQQLWEVTKERGQYNEWDQAGPDDVVAPRFYDAKDRWIDMPPVDDLTGFRADPDEAAVNHTSGQRPPEDSSKWYKVPSAYAERREEIPGGPWRYC